MSDDFMSGEGWAIVGPVAENIANEELEIEKARKDTLGEKDPFTDMDDENDDMDFDFDPEADC